MGVTKANAYAKETAKEIWVTSACAEPLSLLPCLTLEEDEITQCNRFPTEGDPQPNRCNIHHGQYCLLYKKSNVASNVVDDMKQRAELPTKEQVCRFTDWKVALEKAHWVRKYLEVIRVEKIGREIHQRRFFLKVDRYHKRRLELLKREMVRAVNALDALQGRAYELYQPNGTHVMNNPTTTEGELGRWSSRSTKGVLESIRSSDTSRRSILPIPINKALALPSTLAMGVEVEDLIDIAIRAQRERLVTILKPLTGFESFVEVFVEGNLQPEIASSKSMLEELFLIYQQFSRRIIFHQPTLLMKSLESVSFRALIDGFSIEDLARFLDPFLRPMEYPLMWFKDAILDALTIARHDAPCNVDTVEACFPVLGGWVFNRTHTVSMSNEAWWFLLKILRPQADVEHRFVHLCNNFEDLIGFLSLSALGLAPTPSFCKSPSHFDVDDPGLSRNHLSLSGIIVADIVAAPRPPHMRVPMPTTRKATKPDCTVWNELEMRTYMFGAMRNEPDPFVEAFLRELYARPDLFQVVLRSETDPDREVEMFGLRSGSNNEALPAMRARYFEAPLSLSQGPISAPPSPRGEWEVMWSAVDVLYGESKERQGYLVDLDQKPKHGLFYSKTFPVTYFVILDTVPCRDRSVLARNVSWAALRAQGYAEGKYTLAKYAMASDTLLKRCARERLGWMPKDMEWGIVKMEDQMQTCSVM